MTVTVEIPEEIEARLLAQAQACGAPLASLSGISSSIITKTEDRQVAETRLDDRQVPITGSQPRKNLGLDG